MKPEVGKQYEFDGRIIEVTSLTEQGFYYEEVAIAHSKKRFAEYNSFIETRMVEAKKKETNLEHYAKKILEHIYKADCSEISCKECGLGEICETFVNPSTDLSKEFIEWCNKKYEAPKPKLTRFEKEVLDCAVNHGYKWIARDSVDNMLSVHKDEPVKFGGFWVNSEKENAFDLFKDKFQFIQWSDSEPYHIPTLLEECEVVDQCG